MNNDWKGFGSLLLTTLLYSTFGIFTKWIGFELGVFFGAWTRSLFSAVILLIILFAQRKWVLVDKRDWGWIIARSAAGWLLAFTMMYYSFYYLSIATALFIYYAGSTMGGYILGNILFSEHLNRVKIISLLLALSGLSTIYLVNFQLSSPWYMVLALGGGVTTAIWTTFSKKISHKYSLIQLNFLDMVFAGIFFYLGFMVTNEVWVPFEVNIIWAASALFALMFLITGQLVIYGFRYLDAQVASIVMLADIIFGVCLGWLIFREQPTLYTVAGGIIIVAAILYPELYILHQKRRNR